VVVVRVFDHLEEIFEREKEQRGVNVYRPESKRTPGSCLPVSH